ncbi:MAG: NYN domain-containing protein, partial [Anaerolineae bacterium]|nr:NYN domain-containing protein [Anaerolineae bacterium]
MPFLIDGHNVIAALHGIDLEDPDDEAKLVLKLRAWSSRVQRKAIVIFDGGIPGGFSRTMSTADIGVVFAARYHTNADRIIDERLR